MANNLASNTPHATPALLHDFEGRDWDLYPLDTTAIAAALEMWVAKHVRRNVELLRPGDDEADPVAWRIYNGDVEDAKRAVRRGDYNALMPDWFLILCRPKGEGFREALYQCVRHRDKEWTREHVKRLLADEARFEAVYEIFDELNFPKVQAPRSIDQRGGSESSPSPSTGSSSSPEPPPGESSQVNSPTSGSDG